jgi:hypothetical protein
MGTGVGVKVEVGRNVGVAVAGMVGVETLFVGVDSAKGVDTALWQAAVRVRHPNRKKSIFIDFIILLE